MALVLIETDTSSEAVFWKTVFDKAHIKCKISFMGATFSDVNIDGKELPSEPTSVPSEQKTPKQNRFITQATKKCQAKKR